MGQDTDAPDQAALLVVNGRLCVATRAEQESGYGPEDNLFLFRGERGWTILVLRREEEWREGKLVGAKAYVWTEEYANLAVLEGGLKTRWRGAWAYIIEAGRQEDSELHAAWVERRLHRDLESACLECGRGWDGGSSFRGVEALAGQLTAMGYEVRAGPPVAHEPRGGDTACWCGAMEVRPRCWSPSTTKGIWQAASVRLGRHRS